MKETLRTRCRKTVHKNQSLYFLQRAMGIAAPKGDPKRRPNHAAAGSPKPSVSTPTMHGSGPATAGAGATPTSEKPTVLRAFCRCLTARFVIHSIHVQNEIWVPCHPRRQLGRINTTWRVCSTYGDP